jgi:murein DD-endopeptidase MepM/ murein hydrolase activator NlpD
VYKPARTWRHLLVLLALLAVTLAPLPARSQEESGGAVYVVQSGDTLYSIALDFGVSVDELVAANAIADANLLKEGDRLRIPGLDWVSGTLAAATVPYGETLRSLGRRYGVDPALLARLNDITSPSQVYAGASLVLVENESTLNTGARVSLAPGQSLLELAVLQGANPYAITAGNALTATIQALPGEVLRLDGDQDSGPGALPGDIRQVIVEPLPLVQGNTAVIRLESAEGVSAGGSFRDLPLAFYPDNGGLVALQGVNAMTEPGLYPLTVQGSLADGTPFGFTQNVFVRSDNYPQDLPLTVPAETIDPAVTRPEDEQWKALTAPSTPEKLWEGEFILPSNLFPGDWCLETLECFSSRFGNRRSYNGSEYLYYHTGLDLFGGVGIDILAPAAGEVVFAGFLTVRGNATVINHGWGVYTAYMHQSELLVQPGDRVEPGQVIGKIGATGRVQGPHLHWEVLVGGVPVDPLDWMAQEYP